MLTFSFLTYRIGDAIDLFLAYLVVKSCAKIDGGLPPALQYRMYFNILLDFGIGLVPFVGDIADAIFRANTRNAWLLEEYLIKKAETEQQMREEKERYNRHNQQQQRLGPNGKPLPNPGSGAGVDPERPAPKKSFWSSWSRSAPQEADPDQQMAAVDVEHDGTYSGGQYGGQHGDQQSGVRYGDRA